MNAEEIIERGAIAIAGQCEWDSLSESGRDRYRQPIRRAVAEVLKESGAIDALRSVTDYPDPDGGYQLSADIDACESALSKLEPFMREGEGRT